MPAAVVLAASLIAGDGLRDDEDDPWDVRAESLPHQRGISPRYRDGDQPAAPTRYQVSTWPLPLTSTVPRYSQTNSSLMSS